MHRFLKNVLTTLLLTLLLAIIADIGIKAFFVFYSKRSKVDVEGRNASVVFFGSSRVVHSVATKQFSEITGRSAYNMGWAASNPREIYAALKIYLSKNSKPDYVLIQIDAEHDILDEDELAMQSLLKYYYSGLIDDYFDEKTKLEMSIPLYASIIHRDFGWREILKTMINNKPADDSLYGYVPIFRSYHENNASKRPVLMDTCFRAPNPWIRKAIDICKDRNIKVILFTSPIYKLENPNYLSRFSMYKEDYLNLSESLSDSAYFKDYMHVNNSGALLFTEELSKRFLEITGRN